MTGIPDLIWIEAIRNRFLMLSIYRPVRRSLSRRIAITTAFTDGPILYYTETERMEYTAELVENGIAISEGEGHGYGVVYSLADARSFIENHWGVGKVRSWAEFRRPSKEIE